MEKTAKNPELFQKHEKQKQFVLPPDQTSCEQNANGGKQKVLEKDRAEGEDFSVAFQYLPNTNHATQG